MRSIQVKDGDIVVQQGSLQFVVGSQKLVQNLTLWLQEPLEGTPPRGPGYTTPNFGSQLQSYIGSGNTSLTQTQVKAEILRILGIFQQNQLLEMRQAQSVAALGYWNGAEVLKNVLSVDITAQAFTIQALVTIQTLAGLNLTLDINIGQNGITVS